MDDNDGDRSIILVVDDDPEIRKALGRILRHEGHDVLEAPDGETAIALGKAHRPGLVVLDYMLPGMDGQMVLDALREELHEHTPPAVLLSGCGDEAQRAREMGAELALSKPFRVQDLLDAVQRFRRVTRTEAS